MSKHFHKTVNGVEINITHSDNGEQMAVNIYADNVAVYYVEDLEDFSMFVDYHAGYEEQTYTVSEHFAGECGILFYETLSECLGEFIGRTVNRVLYRYEWEQLTKDVCKVIAVINPR